MFVAPEYLTYVAMGFKGLVVLSTTHPSTDPTLNVLVDASDIPPPLNSNTPVEIALPSNTFLCKSVKDNVSVSLEIATYNLPVVTPVCIT